MALKLLGSCMIVGGLALFGYTVANWPKSARVTEMLRKINYPTISQEEAVLFCIISAVFIIGGIVCIFWDSMGKKKTKSPT